MNTYNLAATAATSQSDGVTTTANGASIIIGGVAPNKHALIRFDTSGITAAEEVMQANVTIKQLSHGVGAPPDLQLWASNFGAAIANADYGLASTNTQPVRVPLSTSANPIIHAADADATVGNIVVPSRFILKAGDLINTSFSDFEIRPLVATTGVTDTKTINGAAAVATGDKPTLIVITLTLAELSASNPFRFQAIGAESFFAFSQEPNEGVSVKACSILDADTIGLSQTVQSLDGRGLSSNRVKPRKSTYGRSGAGGSVSFDVTPEKWTPLLSGVLKIVSTTGSGITSDPYIHTFKVCASNEIASFTCVTKKGAFRMVYPGCKVSRLQFSIGMDNIVRATVDLQGLDEYKYDYTSAGLNDEYLMSATAAYDTVANGLWSFVDGSVTVGGVVGNFVQDFTIDLVNDLRERRGLNGQRGPVSHYPLSFMVTDSFNMYFENEVVLRNFFGAQAFGYPFKPQKHLSFDSHSFLLKRTDTIHQLRFDVPKAHYQTISDPIQGEDMIMLGVQAVGNLDDAGTGSNVVVTLTTLEPPSAFSPQSDLITVLPPV